MAEIRINKIKIHSNLVGPVLSVGVSAMLMQVMTMVQQTIMYNTVERWGGWMGVQKINIAIFQNLRIRQLPTQQPVGGNLIQGSEFR